MSDNNSNLQNLSNYLDASLDQIMAMMPNLLNGLLIIFIGFTIGFLLKISSTFIVRYGMSHLPKALRKKPFFKENLSGFIIGLGRLLFVVTVFLSLTISFKVMGFSVLSQWMANLTRYLPNLLSAAFIIFLGWKGKEYISDFIFKALAKAEFSYSRAISRVFGWSIIVISFLVALEQIGIDVSLVLNVLTVLVAVIASGIALTIALGCKATISDILYCYQLNKYLNIGQEIKFQDISGKVKSVGPTFVLLSTANGDVTIPGNLFNKQITLLSPKTEKN